MGRQVAQLSSHSFLSEGHTVDMVHLSVSHYLNPMRLEDRFECHSRYHSIRTMSTPVEQLPLAASPNSASPLCNLSPDRVKPDVLTMVARSFAENYND
jgi:hypothetical protein